ncbi:MAG: ATP-grasp domain-containing protein [Fimbriimonadaceae bacterium]|nr:ATP-grasp domain-containing protein [Fimbriimonadaceae bacterium]
MRPVALNKTDLKADLGLLGGGQLARMSIQAAQRMGLKCLSLDPAANSPASQIAPNRVGALDDPDAIAEIFRGAERVSLENEFIPAEAVREGCARAGVALDRLVPPLEALATIQDKLRQRQALARAGVPCPHAVALDDGGARAIEEIGFPMVLKARFGGYDGKGTRYARSESEFDAHRPLWEAGGWLAEGFVDFRRELAAMVFLGPHGKGCYPTMETVQTNHVCDLVFPSGTDASTIAMRAVEAVAEQGLFGVELFEVGEGEFLVNELAPRPHNTGHYTLDWGATSQFEQHVRLAMGWAPGTVDGEPVCMANLLGQEHAADLHGALSAVASLPGVHVHWYGKAEARVGRKMGHLNVRGGDDLVGRAREARARFYEAWEGK